MKVIDLLNKIANGEEVPKRIKIYQDYYIWYDNEMTGNVGYCKEPLQSDGNSFLTINTLYDLNYEVEIIEEDKKIKKIEKLYKYIDKEVDEKEKDMYYENILKVYDDSEYEIDESISFIVDKINEIIDYLEEKEQC